MGKFIDLTGQKFNRLTVVKQGLRKGKFISWECLCDCGNTTSVITSYLKHGNVKSCGCLLQEMYKEGRGNKRHGFRYTSEYNTYQNIKKRCYNKDCLSYADYGGRGIVMCDGWVKSFENFYADMGIKPSSKHSIERINNDKSYSPENCKWGTIEEQSNNKRNSKILTFSGKSKTLKQWSDDVGINYKTLQDRLSRGWSIERTLTKRVTR